MFLQKTKNKTDQVIELAEIIIKSKKAQFRYREIEDLYKILLNS